MSSTFSKTTQQIDCFCTTMQDELIINDYQSQTDDEKSLSNALSKLNAGGKLTISEKDENILSKLEFDLKVNGFVNIAKSEGKITCSKPNYEVGSSVKLNFGKKPANAEAKAPAVWKLEGDDDDVIDADNLLDEEDLKKPDSASLRVCSTTGKRKACKDCSCGLAQEIAAEKGDKVVDTAQGPKSSCGSCYLGDAFRCATCPYLGMPAFKPGEKVQLSDNLLKADI